MEIYKTIKGFPLYEVSNYGNVRNAKTKKQRKTNLSQTGYERVTLYDGTIKRHIFFVHRLVWINFVGEIPNGYQINHKDECKTNNHLVNLELMTPKENSNYGSRNQRVSEHTKNTHSKTVYQFTLNGEYITSFPSTNEVERQLGFNSSHISDCCKGRITDKRKSKGYINVNSAYGYKWSYNPPVN